MPLIGPKHFTFNIIIGIDIVAALISRIINVLSALSICAHAKAYTQYINNKTTFVEATAFVENTKKKLNFFHFIKCAIKFNTLADERTRKSSFLSDNSLRM